MLTIPFIFLSFLSYITSKDIFSPSKIYLVIFFVFFGEAIFSIDKSSYFYFICFILLIFSLVLMVLEKNGLRISFVNLKKEDKLDINKGEVLTIWLLTMVPVSAQILFINEMGGLVSYIAGIGARVSLWKGFGIYLLLIKLINIINLIYFIKVVSRKVTSFDKLFYLANFSIFVCLSLLSGSRSMLLWNLVFMTIYYHYIIKPISLPKALSMFFLVVLTAMVMGVIRDGYSIDDSGSFSSGVSVEEKLINPANFTYGTKPIHLLLELNELNELSHGKTYLTVFTNLIPRSVFPNKPDPGGVVFTRDILNDPFEGNSYYSTGIVGEAFINFGYELGIIFVFFQLFIIYFFMSLYVKKLNASVKPEKLELFGVYPFILFGLPAYLYAEFTTNTLSIFFFKVFIFYFLLMLINRKLVSL